MQISKQMQGPVTVLALDGQLDSRTAGQVHRELGELLPERGPVLLDLTRTTYLSSAGLRVLLLVHRQAATSGGHLLLAGARPDVRDVMAATGFLDFFTMFDTTPEGITALGG
ncbi:STAS domain-containing protein [Actinophytocola sp.]|uniref:STAS domain-containing protein n=1 Tax=Actinophytocola sp. TaxID=1872138 RepID=UPI00389B20A9